MEDEPWDNRAGGYCTQADDPAKDLDRARAETRLA